MTMSAWGLIFLHLQIFAAVGLAMYVMLVARNGVIVFLIPAIKRLPLHKRNRKLVPATQRSRPQEMFGRTRPLPDFFALLSKSGTVRSG